MRQRAPFDPQDLAELDDRLLSRATAVVSMRDVQRADQHDPTVIGLRHDCDAGHSLNTAVKMARWEADRGYRSTYYILHTSPYWGYPDFAESLDTIAGLGHEIGIHADALAESFRTREHPDVILEAAIGRLRALGHTVTGVAGHGNPICNRDRADGEITFANDEQFIECARPQEGPPTRTITRGRNSLTLAPRNLTDFGLEYEALTAAFPFTFRCSDSGGKWLNPGFDETCDQFAVNIAAGIRTPPPTPYMPRQLHLLLHPDWWNQAFVGQAVAA